jgi:nitroreductase
MSIKKACGRLIRGLFPRKWYKLIANGCMIVPKYYKTIIGDAESYFDLAAGEHVNKDIMLMRKYGHILDKGLHRRDIAPGHSRNYYVLLKDLVDKLSSSEFASDPTYLWACEKLSKYESLQENPEKFLPLESELRESNISYDELFALIKSRRSNRFFLEKEVSDDIIDKLKEIVNWAANSCNKQPIRLFVANNPNLAKECLTCCKGGTGFSDYIPTFWVFAANVRGYVWPSEMYLPAVDTSLGAQNVFLAAHTLGISGTILSWAQKDNEEEIKLRRLLNIPEDYSIIFCAVMGYPEYGYVTPERKFVTN